MLIFSTIPLTKYPIASDIYNEQFFNHQTTTVKTSNVLTDSTIIIPDKDSPTSSFLPFSDIELTHQKSFINTASDFIAAQLHPDDVRYLWSYNEKWWAYRDPNSDKTLAIYVIQVVDTREIFALNKSYFPSIYLVYGKISANGYFEITDENLVVIGDHKRSQGFTDISLQLLKHRGPELNILAPYYHHFNDEFNHFLKSCWRLSSRSFFSSTSKHAIKFHNKKSKLFVKSNYLYSKNHHWGLIWLTYGENGFERNLILQHWHREMIPFNISGEFIDYQSFLQRSNLNVFISKNIVGLPDLNYLRNENKINEITKKIYTTIKSGVLKRYHRDAIKAKHKMRFKRLFGLK